MNDNEVIEAFTSSAPGEAFGPTLHVENQVLMLDGWWHVALRVTPDAYIVRNEEPPTDSAVLAQVGASLAARGLEMVGEDLPLIQPITYTAISLGANSWAMWAPDLATAEAALVERLSRETSFTDAVPGDMGTESYLGFSSELGGARRVGGFPPSIVLTVGVPKEQAVELAAALPDCRVESRTLEELPPEACGALIPNLILVDTTEEIGRHWAMEVRASACGRFLPVVALARDGVPLGADQALDPDTPVGTWIEPLRQLLP